MRIAVFSDSHGEFFRMWEVLGKLHHEKPVGAVLFLGDGYEEFGALENSFTDPTVIFLSVLGNNDRGALLEDFPPPQARIFDLPPHRLLLVHGDQCGASFGPSGPAELARRNGCDVLIHGHTHLPRLEVDRGADGNLPPVTVFCPGSIGEPRRGKASYGLIETDGDGIVFRTLQA